MRPVWSDRKIPVATLTIVFLNVACFLIEAILKEEKASLMVGMYTHALSVGPGAYYRVITSSFMHYGILHLACNMLALLSFGMTMERGIGWWRFTVIYAAGMIGGALLINFAGGNGLHMGASDALWGLMCGLFFLVIRAHGNLESILRCLVLNIAITVGFRDSISWQGHVGGGIAGLIAAAILFSIRPRRRSRIRVADLRPADPLPPDDTEA